MLPLMLAVCKSQPKTAEIPPREPVAVTVAASNIETPETEAPAVENNTVEVTQELYDQTFAEVKAFIENLNKIIDNKDYNAWKNTLSDERFTEISSPDFLARASETPGLKTRKIVLRLPKDYFINVVVPSRANSRVDEIEFVGNHQVKAYFLRTTKKDGNTEVTRLRLYELIKIGNEWKIIS